MNKRRLGRTNVMVGEIGVGCWPIGGPTINLDMGAGWDSINDEDAKEALITAVNMGANVFDTADVYGLGHSERLVGWMLERVRREGIARRKDLIIMTKVGYFRGCAYHGYDPLHIRHQLEMSLQNLKTDFLDVYFFHHLDFGLNDEYLDGAVRQLREFKKQGYIRFIGLRGPHKFSLYRKIGREGFDGSYDRFLRLVDLIDPDVISVRYNMITPKYDKSEMDIFELAAQRDLGIMIYKPLGQGLLLDKYDPEDPPRFSQKDHRSRKPWFREKGLRVLRGRLAKIKDGFGCETTRDLVQLAIRYCLSRSETACVLVGFRNASQLRDSLSTEGYLTESECSFIREMFDGISDEIGEFIDFKAGDNYR